MSVKKILLAQYDLHHALFNNVLDDISEEEANTSFAGMKTIKWLAGHLLWDQGSYANFCGVKVDFPWFGHFHSAEGAAPEDLNPPQSELPTLEMIKTNWNETVPRIRAGLEKLTKANLSTVISIPHPLHPFDDTIAGLWAFVNHHQAYNIGQISVLRRGFGKKGMSYSV
jgi:hypothetical protein